MLHKTVVVLVAFCCIVNIYGLAVALNDTKTFDECIEDDTIKNAFKETQVCFGDIIKDIHDSSAKGGSCHNVSDFRSTYTKAVKEFGNCSNYFETIEGRYNRQNLAAFIKQSLNETMLKSFFENDGTNCLKNKLDDLVQCVKDKSGFSTSVDELYKNTKSSTHWLMTTKKLSVNNSTCSTTDENMRCFEKVLNNTCKEPVIAYITSLSKVFLKICSEIKEPNTSSQHSNEKPMTKSSIAITAVLVIMAVGVVGVLFKFRHQISSKIKTRQTEERSVAFTKTN